MLAKDLDEDQQAEFECEFEIYMKFIYDEDNFDDELCDRWSKPWVDYPLLVLEGVNIKEMARLYFCSAQEVIKDEFRELNSKCGRCTGCMSCLGVSW